MNLAKQTKVMPRCKTTAFTRVELLCVAGVISGILLWALVAMDNARHKSHQNECVWRLRTIGQAFQGFAFENTNSFPFSVSTNAGGTKEYARETVAWPHWAIFSYNYSIPQLVYCPADENRLPAETTQSISDLNLSYFFGVTSSPTTPKSVLAGDRTLMTNNALLTKQFLEIKPGLVLDFASRSHRSGRNFLFADGSVQQFSEARLAAHLKILKQSTNIVERWVFP